MATKEEGGSEFVLLLLRGDHDLNEIKAQKVVGEFRFARDEEIVEALALQGRLYRRGRLLRQVSWPIAASRS
jgi:hypothetical protein